MQGTLIILAAGWAVFALIAGAQKTVAAIVMINLVVNLLFFLTHPISTQYYLMPLAMLSLWALLFSTEIDRRMSMWKMPVHAKYYDGIEGKRLGS
jgi:hypothetical protein